LSIAQDQLVRGWQCSYDRLDSVHRPAIACDFWNLEVQIALLHELLEEYLFFVRELALRKWTVHTVNIPTPLPFGVLGPLVGSAGHRVPV